MDDLVKDFLQESTENLGLVVDEIGDVADVSSDLSETPPETLCEAVLEVTHQVYKLESRLLLDLDTERARFLKRAAPCSTGFSR